MDENKMLAIVSPRRRHPSQAERERILARWAETGVSARELARRTGVSPSSLFRWKQGRRQPRVTQMPGPDLLEVPAPVGDGWAAEANTGCGPLRFSAHASPQWAAQLLRELARC